MKLIPSNPFQKVKAPSSLPEERRYYLSPSDTEKLIAIANPTWQVIVALTRYAGLRCPSEVLSLKWEHVRFETGRMTVPSPKIEHHPGGGFRVCPIFKALCPHLIRAFKLAAEGEEYVVGGRQGAAYRATANTPEGWVNSNLRTTFVKLIRRAGLTRWPRVFQNLRASCETDLMAAHPIHVVCRWLGNSPTVALKHYVQVLENDVASACGAESGAARSGRDGAGKSKNTGASGNCRVR